MKKTVVFLPFSTFKAFPGVQGGTEAMLGYLEQARDHGVQVGLTHILYLVPQPPSLKKGILISNIMD